MDFWAMMACTAGRWPGARQELSSRDDTPSLQQVFNLCIMQRGGCMRSGSQLIQQCIRPVNGSQLTPAVVIISSCDDASVHHNQVALLLSKVCLRRKKPGEP